MMLGGVEWKAKSTRAKIDGGVLTISGSGMDGDPAASVVRQSIELRLEGYTGPGQYMVSSNPLQPSLSPTPRSSWSG